MYLAGHCELWGSPSTRTINFRSSYLANKHDPVLNGATTEQKALVDMLGSALADLKGSITGVCYMQDDKAVPAGKAMHGVKRFVEFLQKKGTAFLAGDGVTWVDFYFLEMLELMTFLTDGQVLAGENAVLAEWRGRMLGLSGVATQVEAEKARIFNNKSAKVNNM